MQNKRQGEQMKRARYPRLLALRAARAQREAVIREPLERELQTAASMIRELGHQLDQLRRFLGTEISKHVTKPIGHATGNALRREIVRALSAAGRKVEGDDLVRMEFSAAELRWADPDSVERRVLEDWKARSAPHLRVTFPKTGELMKASDVTAVLDVRVPELGYRQYINNHALERV